MNDPRSADNDLRGKYLEVTGIVREVGADRLLLGDAPLPRRGPENLGDAYNRIAAASASGAKPLYVECVLRNHGVRVGQTITIRGKCSGRVANVMLQDCSLASH
jgi:hypothetical protein